MKRIALSILFVFNATDAMQQSIQTLSPEKKATFIALQKIYAQAQAIAYEMKDVCNLEISPAPTLDFSQGQTTQGLRLIVRIYPRFLETPWGLVPLFTKAEYNNPHSFDLPMDKFLEKITTKDVEELSNWPYKNNNDACLKKNFRTEAAIQSVSSKHGLLDRSYQIMAYNDFLRNHPGSIYAINTINGETCPPAIICSKTEYRTLEELKIELQLLKEVTINNSTATTPSTKTPPSPKSWFGQISPKQIASEQTTSGSLASSSTSFTSARSNFTSSLSSLPTSEPLSPQSPLSSRPNSPSRQDSSTLTVSNEDLPLALSSPVKPTTNQKCSLM